MVNSLFTVVSERTVSTTKHYNVTESFLRQSFYPYHLHSSSIVTHTTVLLSFTPQFYGHSHHSSIVTHTKVLLSLKPQFYCHSHPWLYCHSHKSSIVTHTAVLSSLTQWFYCPRTANKCHSYGGRGILSLTLWQGHVLGC